jgi:hypothetical protein
MTFDINKRQFVGIGTIPVGPNAVTSASFSINANTTAFINVTTKPGNSALSLWNFLYSIVIDSTATNSSGEFLNLFPSGSGLTTGQLKTRLANWADWATSSDQLNTRVNVIQIANNDSVSHTYYFYFKSYTFATVTGAPVVS